MTASLGNRDRVLKSYNINSFNRMSLHSHKISVAADILSGLLKN